jgi:beta-amyrin synthase
MLPPEIVGEKMEPERLYDSVNLLLSLQASTVNFIAIYFSLID